MATFNGTSENETINGTAEDDVISTGGGNDEVNAGAGNDTIEGGEGVNILNGEAGDDYFVVSDISGDVDGGEGVDTIDFSNLSQGINVINSFVAGRFFGGILGFANIENITGTSFQDFIAGNDADNLIIGNGGSDVFRGSAGMDTLIGAVDSTIGDAVNYADSDAAVSVNLSTGTASGGFAEGDVLVNIRRIGGTIHADSLVGSDNGVRFEGAGGDDTLIGGAGNDTLVGGFYVNSNNNNRIVGGAGDDLIVLDSSGADTVDGGAGNDTLDYSATGRGRTVDLLLGTTEGGNSDTDILSGVENALAGFANDTLLGSNVDNLLSGGRGADYIDGREGNDTLLGGDDTVIGDDVTDNDTLVAGAGDDLIDVSFGINTVIVADGHGNDTVRSLDAFDVLDFTGLISAGFVDLDDVIMASSDVTQNGRTGVLINTGGDSSLFLEGRSVSDLNQLNYRFNGGGAYANPNLGVRGGTGDQTDRDDYLISNNTELRELNVGC